MKKLMIVVMTMVFGLAFGTAYAMEAGNGITDFNGGWYDAGPVLHTVPAASSVEGSNPGGMRITEVDPLLNNGVTDFVGRNYDISESATGPLAPSLALHSKSVLGSSVYRPNGITDFIGATHD